MTETRIKISSIVENQLPQFVREEFPLVQEFLSQYYISLEGQGSTGDVLQNIDQYIKVDNLTNLVGFTTLTQDVTLFDSTINVYSTAGFPDSYGLLLIDSEIITYTSKTANTFEGCVRGFNGITSYTDKKDELTFSESDSQSHSAIVNNEPTKVNNLSILFLQEFLIKVKKQITPGFENRELYSDLNERLFIKQAIDFYSSKGTDNSFKILFGALYGENVEVIKPRDYLIQASDAQYRITSDLIVEEIEGNVESLLNTTLYQDEDEFISSAKGTITKIEKIRRSSKDYYQISLDYDYDKDILPSGTVFGEFAIHPKTKLVSNIDTDSTTLEVDSTVSFPTSGNLIIDLDNGTSLNVLYTSKTLNQFLGCSGITQAVSQATEIKYDAYAYGNSETGLVKVRILGVLKNLNIPNNTSLYSKGDTIRIKTLGINLVDEKYNNWFYNIPSKYDISGVSILDFSDRSYRFTTSKDHSFKVGNSVTLSSSTGIQYDGFVTSLNGKKSFDVQFGSESSLLDLNVSYVARRNLSKVSANNYPTANQYTSNVQNVYYDNENDFYVASPSLPSYLNESLEIQDRSVTFSGSFSGTEIEIGEHKFYTGDSIVYKPSENNTLGIETGIYFIKKVSNTKVKLSRSKNNIFADTISPDENYFVTVNGTVTNARFELTSFNYKNLSSQPLESQRLIRKISTPQNENSVYETNIGLTGIFVNGVELLNYKSSDDVFYGPIEEIVVTSPGEDYDIVNPPVLQIDDPIGVGASGYCSIIGGLERVDIIDPGFDYLEEPIIEIKGGNGSGVSAKTKLISFDHNVIFNSQSSAELVKLNPVNSVSFSEFHKFRDNEEVIYVTDGQTSVGGLSTNSSYVVSVVDSYTIKLHKSVSDSISGINTIQLTSYGTGNHSFKSVTKKKKIGSIFVETKGSNYQNKLKTVSSIGINTSTDVITIENHEYQSGEIVKYESTGIPIGGLSNNQRYFITKLNDDQFKVSNIGSSGVTTSFYYDTEQYVNLTSVGSGIHKFNYPEIVVSIKGKIGVSTLSGQDFNARIQPIFRGQVQSVHIESGGTKYGSEEVINFNRQPLVSLDSGSGATATAVVQDGQIVNVFITSPGSGYNSPPNIIVNGSGSGAVLTPILSNGTISELKVVYGGSGYSNLNTKIDIIPSGKGSKFESKIKSWKINLVERLLQNSQIPQDDGILTSGLNSNYGLQYSHAYAPRYLRRSVQSTTFENGEKVYVPDLQLFNNTEQDSVSHSPIIGWSYDGNPIYGPYGYSSKTGGSIKSLKSSYELILKEDRPKTSLYPAGLFVEDYSYTNNGDLDEYNGRFCVTPEYPNGVYAYFTTIDSRVSETGTFLNYRRPIFPYAIGNFYKSKPIDFNFLSSSNQDDININDTGWLRNTSPYNLLDGENSYDFITNPNRIKEQNSTVKSIAFGSLNSIGIVTGGKDYKVGDALIFSGDYLSKSSAKVSKVKGKKVNQISVASSSFDNVKLYPYGNDLIGFTSVPHNYNNNDLITFTGKYDYRKSGSIRLSNNTLVLSSGVGSASYTGLVTFFNVFGNLDYPNIKENDVYQIGQEKVKVLNIEKDSSRIRVLRNYESTTGLVTYTSGSTITEKTRKFTVNLGLTTSYNFNVDKEIYFNPKESVGLGTLSGVGIISTVYFSNPGVGVTQINIPTQSIYIKDHNIKTGDSLVYSSNGGTVLSVSTNGQSSLQLSNNSIVYAAKISNDLIGISTTRVGIGSTGSFVGIGSISAGILYFTSHGTGDYHSFKTNYDSPLVGKIYKNVVTVSTDEPHELSLLDKVTVNVKSGVSTTVVVKYDDYNRRLVTNPKSYSIVDIENNILQVNSHGYYTGQKVLHTSSSSPAGLVNKQLYYVVVIDANSIKLANTYYDSTILNPNVINISSSGTGLISEINPLIKVYRDQQIIFDLSDSSLSFVNSGITYSAFDFKIYFDENFVHEFDKSASSTFFDVVKEGMVGIDTTSKLTLTLKEDSPKNLYYKLVPINLNINPQVKTDIIVDKDVTSNNKISITNSVYSGEQIVVGITSNTFAYNIIDNPEIPSYSDGIEYHTTSNSTKGSIKEVKVVNGGKYKTLPYISSITTQNGSGADLEPITNSIGKVTSVEILDIGFEYSSDYSIRPTAKLPELLYLESLNTVDYIDIISFGRNYSSVPNLVAIDGVSNEVIEELRLSYSFGDSRVRIIQNSKSIGNAPLKIVPTNNSNGIGVTNIQFNNTTKDVVVSLAKSFSDPEDFPFSIGSKILIEGVSVGINSDARGYNSQNYNYNLFTITDVDPNLGGEGATITYNLSSYLNLEEVPGEFNRFYSSGKVVLEDDFPKFNVVLKKNVFYVGETVTSDDVNGIVENWDSLNQILKVSTTSDFISGKTVTGKSSSSVALINKVLSNDTTYDVGPISERRKGWNKETGFLNNDLQRIHDNDYYQYFSYSLKSKKDIETWNDAVSSLNHTSGFKKFSNLIIESTNNIGISTQQNESDILAVSDLSRVIDLNCVNDFDLVKENNLFIDSGVKSNEIYFDSRYLQDYIESIGNRVLIIDDISNQFNSNPRVDEFSIVDTFLLSDVRSIKYIISVQDKRYLNESQLSLVSLQHNDSVGFLNQYGIETVDNLGFFDFNITGNTGNLLFYPTKPKYNNYVLKILSFSLNDLTTGIGTVNLGNVANVQTSTFTLPQGTSGATSIVGIASTYRSSKVVVQIGATDTSYYEFDEITYIHDNNQVYIIDYGQISSNTTNSFSYSGIGTYNAYLSGNQVVIDLIPNETTTVDYVVNTLKVSIANTNFTGIGTQIIGGSSLVSTSTSIASTSSPVPTVISSYSNTEYSGTYSIISVEDLTNSKYQVSEFLTITNEFGSNYNEFGIVRSGSQIGIITSGDNGSTTNIYFTPDQNTNVDVKVFQVNIGLSEQTQEISLTNGAINYDYSIYTGTHNDVRKEFELKHKGLPIFKRYFDGSSLDTVIINNNAIRIPNHFYSTGEEIVYSYPGYGTTQAVGIATTTVPGIGSTNKLPSKLYVVKISDLDIRLASSASDALKEKPVVLELTSVGIGSSHVFTAKNPNNKSLISIDNVIQSPIVSTSTTTTLSKKVSAFDSDVYVNNVSSIFSGDIIKINSELMKVASVGVGSTNSVSVLRYWMGTGISTHNSSDLITKVTGNYNIIENTIYFSESPYGEVLGSNSSNRPDEFDYVGISTGSTFGGRVFLRTGVPNSSSEAYVKNYIFDDISDQFDGIKKSFTLKSSGSNITGVSTSNSILLINEIFQTPSSSLEANNYDLSENTGITSVTFVGNQNSLTYDVNIGSVPRGGIILSIASSQGFGYQPLVSAGGTAVVSTSGTIQSISIGNSGSGYRSGIQTFVNVGVQTESNGIPNIEIIGRATVNNGYVSGVSITNPGSGYTSSNPPKVVFDAPLSYSNIPLVYSSSSVSGVGTGAVVDIIVGQGSSVVSFELKNLGFGYKQKEILTVSIGGTTGIPTTSSFREFTIQVDRTQSDTFSAWTVGDLQVLDSIESLFDGVRTTFPLNINNNRTTIRSRVGSNIDVQSTLLVFINDVLQVPGVGYVFNGGSRIRFTEPPKLEDKCTIIFYRGTEGVDTKDVDILETIKIGDTVTINSNEKGLQQDSRLVNDIISSDTVSTTLYSGPGITQNEKLSRPLKWCKQTQDLIIDEQAVGKDRIIYESYVQPSTYLIRNVGTSSTEFFVESVKAFFDSEREYLHNGTSEKPQNKITIVSQDNIVSASGTAVVSISGTISSIDLSIPGFGYVNAPIVSISNPIGIGTSGQAKATAVIVNSSVSSVTITTGGFGYDPEIPPTVLFESPSPNCEVINNVSYTGDFGVIVGVQTVSVGVASTGIVFDFFIPTNSILRDPKINKVGIATTGISGIQTGHYFVVNNSNIGMGITSLDSLNNVVGVGTQFIDNIYQVASVSIAQTSVPGIGLTNVAKVITSVSNYNNLTGTGFSSFYGEYSWGKISTPSRVDPKQFTSYANTGGISTSPVVQRYNRLKYNGYSTT